VCDRKGTPRITGLSRPIVHIDGAVWYIAVGSSYPGCAQAAKGVGVHALKGIVSWVKNVKYNANEFCTNRNYQNTRRCVREIARKIKSAHFGETFLL